MQSIKRPIQWLIFIACIFPSTFAFGQVQNSNIDPVWDNYYKEHPSGITEHHQATDFINVINTVGFVPTRKEFQGKTDLLKKILLGLSANDLRQMYIDGWYYSRTVKHDDYFQLYNIEYKKIDADTWNKYAPYLIPLMNIDGVISLNN